jgi:Mn2+/Fe2+ NRAMP family transporter
VKEHANQRLQTAYLAALERPSVLSLVMPADAAGGMETATAPPHMGQVLELALGVVTSIGGFLEIGSIATAAQAGAAFGYQLGWSIVLGTVCIACLLEMSGRFAACSKRTIADAMRERFGGPAFLIVLAVMFGVSVLVLGAELGGTAAALELATGLGVRLWVIPVAVGAWALLWYATFGVIENGVSLLGLVTVVFAVAAVRRGPNYHALLRGLAPSMPSQDGAHYWFIAVSVLGASISPYLYYFYSSGAIEDKWDESHLNTNRWVAGIGMGFGGFLSIAVLVLAALVFHPSHPDVNDVHDLATLVARVLGRPGFWLFAAALGIACLGATLEIALSLAYLLAQGLGWSWGQNLRPTRDARFSVAYTVILAAGALLIVAGIDPLQLTSISMALTATSLPVCVLPFLILMNDRHYLGDHTNGAVGNAVVLAISVLALVLGVVSIPLQLIGS